MNMGADLSEAEYASLARFRYLLRRYLAFSERAATAAGLESRQYQLLLALRARPHAAASVTELAEALQVQHHSAVGLIDRTSARGLVERQPDPEDGRRVLVVLTPTGRAALTNLAVQHREELRRVAPDLVEAIRDTLDEGAAPDR
jgi:DNA-binding MarR family transcriptional regulator